MRHTQKGEIEKFVALLEVEGFLLSPIVKEMIIRALERFGKKERKEAHRQDIATITRCLEMKERAREAMVNGRPPDTHEYNPYLESEIASVARYILGES